MPDTTGANSLFFFLAFFLAPSVASVPGVEETGHCGKANYCSIHSQLCSGPNISNFSAMVALTPEGPGKMAHEVPTVWKPETAVGVACSLLSVFWLRAPAADGSPFSSRCHCGEW